MIQQETATNSLIIINNNVFIKQTNHIKGQKELAIAQQANQNLVHKGFYEIVKEGIRLLTLEGKDFAIIQYQKNKVRVFHTYISLGGTFEINTGYLPSNDKLEHYFGVQLTYTDEYCDECPPSEALIRFRQELNQEKILNILKIKTKPKTTTPIISFPKP